MVLESRLRRPKASLTRIGDEVTGHAVEVLVAVECSGLDYGPIMMFSFDEPHPLHRPSDTPSVHDKMKGPGRPCVLVFHTRIATAASPRVWVLGNLVLELLLPAGWTVLSAITAVFPPLRRSAVHRRLGRGVRAAAHRVHSGALFGDRRREARMARERSLAASARHAWHRERSLAASEAVNDRFGAENGLTWR